jgi:enoyl-CoA hydratase/carnithine racemase
MTAQTALRVGIVTEVVPDDELRSRAFELAAEIATRRTQGIQGTVRAMWESRDLPPTTAARHGMSYTHIGNAGATPDSLNNKKRPRTR